MLKATRPDRMPTAKREIIKKNNNTKGPKNFNFRFFKKYFLYILILILLIFFSLVIFAPMFINLKVWKPEIISMLEENTGKIASIKGDIELKIYPSPQIKINDISLIDENSGITNNFLRSKSVVAKLAMLPLFKGDVVIDRIVFDNITLNLLNSSNKKPNWVFEKTIREENQGDEFNSDKYSKFNQIKYPNIKVNEYEIINGTIIYNNTSKIDLKNITIISNGNIQFIDGQLNINKNKYLFNSSSTKNENIKNSWNTQLSINNNVIDINAALDINYIEYFPNITGELELNYNNIQKILDGKSFRYVGLFDQKSKIKGNLSLQFKDYNLYYSIFNISANIGPFPFTGALSGNNGSKPDIEIAFSTNNIDLDLFLEQIQNINSNDKNISNDLKSDTESYWHQHSGKILLSIGTSKLLDYPIRNISIEIDKDKNKYFLKSGNATFPGNTNIQISGLLKNEFSIFEGTGSLESDNIRDFYNWLSVDLNNISDARLRKTSLSSEVVFRKGGATFAGIEGKIDSSNVSGEARLRFGEVNSAFANIKIDKINLDSYLNNKSEKKIINNLNKFNLFTFDIVNFDIELENLLFSKNKYNNIVFKNTYKNNILNIEKLEILDFAGGRLNASGQINYEKKDKEYDLLIDINHDDFSKMNDFFQLPYLIRDLVIGEGNIKIALEGNFNKSKSNVIFENSDSNMTYVGDIKVKNYSIGDFSGDVTISSKNIGDLIDLGEEVEINYASEISQKNSTLSIKNISIDSSNNNYSGNIFINSQDKDVLDIDINFESESLDILTIKTLYNYFYKDLKLLVKGGLKINSKLFTINDYKIYDLDSQLNFSENSINIKKFKGKLYGGSINAEVKILNNDLYDYNGKITFKNINGSDFFSDYFTYNNFDTEISSELLIKGKANNLDDFFVSMIGEGEVYFKRNLLKGFDANNIINTNNIQGNENLINHVYQSFNTKSEKKLDDFTIKYIYGNGNLTFETFEIKINNFFTLLEGQLNFKTRDFIVSSKFFLNNDLNNFLSLNLSRTNNILLNTAENNTSIDSTDINVKNNEDIISNIEDISNLDNVLDDLSDLALTEDKNQEEIMAEDKDKLDNEQTLSIINSEEPVKKAILPLFLKDIRKSLVLDYYKPNKIINSLAVPRLPTEEDILDELLESVLSPDD